MHGIERLPSFTCARCLRDVPHRRNLLPLHHVRNATNPASPPNAADNEAQSTSRPAAQKQEDEEGAMSRRLSDMTDESLKTGGRSARKAVEESGFSEELKRKLEDRIANATFRSENANAFAQANMPASAGRGTRDIAAAQAWTGTESIEDASLRMLNDAHKPLRTPSKIPGIRVAPTKVDTGRPRERTTTGVRLANARDKSSVYAVLKDPSMSEKEREKFRAELKQRFQPGARVVPATIQGLASLANERIEDAIARGQFKNLPNRGKKIERDYNASSPFINTTEYFMNKIIQKQEIVPPWIEKQQELVSTANRFRGRLRADWKRHVSRSIASRGGSLEGQMTLAEEYALAERVYNPQRKSVEKMNAVDGEGRVSQITLAGELKATSPAKDAEGMEATEIEVIEQAVNQDGTPEPPAEQIVVSGEHSSTTSPQTRSQQQQQQQQQVQHQEQHRHPTVPVFRDPQWEQTELAYLRAAVENLNSMTRSYNLMAPDLAKKPYFSLDRELKACYADVAPLVAGAIRERALAPKIRGHEVIGHRPGGVLEKFSWERAPAKVYDERKPQYGFREFWKDLFAAR